MKLNRRLKKPNKKMAIGGVVAGVGALNELGRDIKADTEQTDAQGNLVNKNKTGNMAVLGGMLNPLELYGNKDFTTGEKLHMTVTGGLAGALYKDKYADRIETRAKQEASRQFRGSQENLRQNNSMISNQLMPMGGMVPGKETVELEKGEPFMTPDGQIHGIPNNAPTHAQGGVPITLPSGTKVLGKKPATDEKTFKQLGKKLENKQKKYQSILDDKPTRIEKETATRMLDKVNAEFNTLFDLQGEDTQNNQQFEDGGKVTTERGVSAPYYRNLTEKNFYDQLQRKGLIQPGYDTLSTPEINQQIRSGYNVPEGFAAPYQINEDDKGNKTYQKDFGRNQGEYYNSDGSGEVIDTYNKPREGYAYGGMIRKGYKGLQSGFGAYNDYQFGMGQQYDPTEQFAPELSQRDQLQFIPAIGDRRSFAPYDVNSNQNQPNKIAEGSNFNIGNTLGTIGALAPTAYNLYQGMQKPDQVATNAFQNPYESEVRATMRDRRYNTQPELEAARTASATYTRNLRGAAPSQSQYLGGLQAGAIAEQRATGQALARQQNANNQYAAEQAQMDANLGQANSQRQQYIEDINSRSKAAQEQYIATGMSQLGQYAQIKRQENNQMIRDAQRLNLLPALVQNFQLNENGQWVFKETGEAVDPATAINYVKGLNIQ